VNKWAAKGNEKKGIRKACKKQNCQGCDFCASLLQSDAVAMDDDEHFEDANAHDEAPICHLSDVQAALDDMTPGCDQKLRTAIASNTPLRDVDRCLCYLEVERSTAMALKCRTMEAKTQTLAEEYNACEVGSHQWANEHGTCPADRMTALINTMPKDCQESLYSALEKEQPLTFERRCECYLKIEQQTALQVNCFSMPEKSLTVAQEYQQCLDAQAAHAAA
jgi:hypothetical protein